MERDDELYGRFLTGDTAAYDALMLRYGDRLTLYLNGYLHDFQDAEDMMIEAFARIMVKKPHIRDGGFKAYLYKTGRNLAYRFAAKKNKFRSFSLEELTEEIPGGELPEKVFEKAEDRRLLFQGLSRINPMYREALWLVCFENLSYKEAARITGTSGKKIDNLLTRGKQALRKELEKEGMTYAFE